MELIIDRVSKQYKNKIAVDRISLKLHKGVHGLLGANGAGKTTVPFLAIYHRILDTTRNLRDTIFSCTWPR